MTSPGGTAPAAAPPARLEGPARKARKAAPAIRSTQPRSADRSRCSLSSAPVLLRVIFLPVLLEIRSSSWHWRRRMQPRADRRLAAPRPAGRPRPTPSPKEARPLPNPAASPEDRSPHHTWIGPPGFVLTEYVEPKGRARHLTRSTRHLSPRIPGTLSAAAVRAAWSLVRPPRVRSPGGRPLPTATAK